ncbi:flagellar biosynthesis protein FlhF [Neobacillus kokaensis]|uniref:Flagellar biosynthesis protein FlhF n=1 Tax=Neobacillus kokaensis TaxID=2759023 RepID=A0ABQ3N4U9_9BACI|nr:flagellar biosynthesis protein FlhF [Neobacillus kokaensis]GHH99965.1 flagellar biosynthesis regulator FlhF [Neobacillus kokaensis]
MMIKTYVVNTIAEAYPMIFQDLGTNAFILNTKPVRTGFFRKKRVEVVAAVDLSAPKPLVQEEVKPLVESKWECQPKQTSVEVHADQPSQPDVLKELSEVKALLHSLLKDDSVADSIPKPLEKWVLHLRDQEVDEEVIRYIVKKVQMKQINLGSLSDLQIEQLLMTIIKQLFEEGIAKDSVSSACFITLLGPTGVGKTTTIAKLAAARVFQQRQKVGLLTTDTFRIAAVDQLKTYASILHVPLEVVADASELKGAMERLKGCHTVFMDSAGRNYLEEEYIEEINQYLRYDVPQENYLVLSMTTRWRDMRRIVDQMKAVPIDKLILTKMDETSCYGVALNMVYHYPYPLAYVSLGQGVPQDIMKADPIFMAKKILGADENESGSSTSIKTII